MNAFAIDGRLKTQVHLSNSFEAKKKHHQHYRCEWPILSLFVDVFLWLFENEYCSTKNGYEDHGLLIILL